MPCIRQTRITLHHILSSHVKKFKPDNNSKNLLIRANPQEVLFLHNLKKKQELHFYFNTEARKYRCWFESADLNYSVMYLCIKKNLHIWKPINFTLCVNLFLILEIDTWKIPDFLFFCLIYMSPGTSMTRERTFGFVPCVLLPYTDYGL